MAKPPVRDKASMYRLLRAGEFGNTNLMWTSLSSWDASKWSHEFDWWGIRSASKCCDDRCRMYVKTHLVSRCVKAFGDDPYVISPMVDLLYTVTARLNVCDADGGLYVEGEEYPAPGTTWKDSMANPTRYEGTAARVMLRRHLNSNSFDDLMVVLEQYPNHVVEISALDRCFGTVPGRNAVCWEVRGTF